MQPPQDASATATRQTQLIKLAEGLLHDYYTRLSENPTTLVPLYVEDAELIYTGKELNVDAVYSTGRSEIHEFFRSPTAQKFRGARFRVDALHPQASPASPLGVVLFAKGRVWLPRDEARAVFYDSPFVHFLALTPPAKLTEFGTMPEMKIANEYLHLLNLPGLCIARDPSPVPPAVLSSEPPAKQTSTEPTRPTVLRRRPSAAGAAPPPPPPRTVHAQPGFPPEMSEVQLIKSITAAVQRLGGTGSCVNISKPKNYSHVDPKYSYFFIHLDTPETVQMLVDAGKLEVDENLTLRLSPSIDRPKTYGRRPWTTVQRESPKPRFRPSVRTRGRRNSVEVTSGSRLTQD